MCILHVILKIILAPILLALKLLFLFCAFLIALSTSLLSVAASLMGFLAILVIFTVNVQSGVALLVVAWLISPAGLPLLAEKALYALGALVGFMRDRIYGASGMVE